MSKKNLMLLKVIAETLNRSNDLNSMLQYVLTELLKVTGLTTGWIFLIGDRPHYRLVASCNIPPALSWEDNKPMCKGTCFCLNKYWNGKLTEPVNIIECKRLEDAVKYSWGETNGISHHATVPLIAGDQQFGVLNVAAPGKKVFSEEELTILHSVALQIGTAVKKTRLYHSQKERAENFAKVDEVIRYIWGITDLQELPEKVVDKCEKVFKWSVIAFYMKQGNELKLCALHHGEGPEPIHRISLDSENDISRAFAERKIIKNNSARHLLRSLGLPTYSSSIAIPLFSLKEGQQGVFLVADKKSYSFPDSQIEVLKALSNHVSLAMESIVLNEKRQDLLVQEERNRLARDLHDSVSQKLFSLSLTSRAVKEIIPKEAELIHDAMTDIQQLSKEALTEMKSLIWQLRPTGLEEGLITALKKYGHNLGITVFDHVEGVRSLPCDQEEALWRIGQEALNNVKKHAFTDQALVSLRTNDDCIHMEICDKGNGFHCDEDARRKQSLGLTTMKERAELLGGSFQIVSTLGNGTTVSIVLPLDDIKERGDYGVN